MATASASSSSAAVTERRGIPGAQFVEEVQTYLTQAGLNVNLPSPFSKKSSAHFDSLLFPLTIVLSNFNFLLQGIGTVKMYACLLEQYKLVELKLQAQQRDLQFSFAQKIPFL